MEYSKPKVTIDLDEYLDLNKEVSNNKQSESVVRETYLLNVIFEIYRKVADKTSVMNAIYAVHRDKYSLMSVGKVNSTENPFVLGSK